MIGIIICLFSYHGNQKHTLNKLHVYTTLSIMEDKNAPIYINATHPYA